MNVNAAKIFDLIEKGLVLLPTLIEAGVDVRPRIEKLISLSKQAAAGHPISAADLAKIRADFDADLDDFNKPIP
jgi:hypothetical protein